MTPLPRRHRDALARAVQVSCEADAQTAATAPELTQFLYAHWYTRLSTPKAAGWHGRVPFLTRLRQALTHAALARGRATLPGIMASELLVPGNGYWSVQGARLFDARTGDLPDGPPQGVRRVYWNVTQDGAPALVHDMVAALPEEARWHFKVPLLHEDYQRPDAVVLYVDADAWPRIEPLVASLAAVHRGQLHPELPPLTSRIEAGVATARDPGIPGESFGLTLCRRVAEVLLSQRSAAANPVTTLTAALFPTAGSARRRPRTARRPDG